MSENPFNSVRDSDLRWYDERTQSWIRIDENILSISANYTMDMCSQLTVQVLDPNFNYAENNFFWITRTVAYRAKKITGAISSKAADDRNFLRSIQLFEIASAQVAPGPGTSPTWTLELRTKTVQQMKRDKNPSQYKGSGNGFVSSVAAAYGMEVLMQRTSKTQTIQKASGDRVADSTWDVLQRLASDSNFVCFETDNVLVFASQRYLQGLYGGEFATVPYTDPETNQTSLRGMNFFRVTWPQDFSKTIIPMAMPSIRSSENDPLEASGSVSVDRLNGVALRPGMSIGIDGMAWFNKIYLIDSVTFDHFGSDPVQVSFRTPEREEKFIKQYDVGPIMRNPLGWE